MTAKEKANELVCKFFSPEKDIFKLQAKKYALIVVEEIDAAVDFDWMEVQNLDREHNYWNEVKKEIELL